MYDPLLTKTRIINIPGTDTVLQIMLKKGHTHILPLSKEKLRGSPDSWKMPAISGTMLFSTIFIWGWVFALPALPVLLAASPVFLLASIIGMKALNNFMLTEPAYKEASEEDERDFNSGKHLPEIIIDKDLMMAKDKSIIEAYREQVFTAERTNSNKNKEYIADRTFSKLFNDEKVSDDEEQEQVSEEVVEPVFVENDETNNSYKLS